ncbi:MAG: DUF4065 domain-containing protein [Asticcacaulis sp.]|nr:DUF4065 domain-containing protein [Asticcacaulis sp.]
MHDSRTVANYLLQLARADNNPITPMKLLKLVYIAHGWCLGLYGRPLISDDVQAWKYGPVIPRLYSAVRDFKSSPVDKTLPSPRHDDLLEWEKDLVRQTYDRYGHMSGVDLSRLTHQPRTPWHYVYDEQAFGEVIPMDLIQSHYERLASQPAG